jgi:hypothetical protein
MEVGYFKLRTFRALNIIDQKRPSRFKADCLTINGTRSFGHCRSSQLGTYYYEHIEEIVRIAVSPIH